MTKHIDKLIFALLIAAFAIIAIDMRDIKKQKDLIEILQVENMDLQDSLTHDCVHPLDELNGVHL